MKPKVLVTQTQLEQLFPSTNRSILAEIVEPLNKTLYAFGITTKQRICMFLAQVGHESGEFKFRRENLNYSAKALLTVFGKYFTPQQAQQYQRKPEAIANRVYANRMGNGPETSGDGWKYRGRGYIQLTGKNNYSLFAKSLNMTLDQAIMYLETVEGAIMSAGWFWNTNKLNVLADAGRFTAVTQRINGGQNGAAHRQKLYEKALTIIK